MPASLCLQTVSLHSATLEPPSNLVPIARAKEMHEVDASVPIDEELRHGVHYGRVRNTAPYLPQNRYNRAVQPREHCVIVLENEQLRAEILPGLGGRLRALRDKATGREALYANEVFQPANLALRNAWFSGGVEWNIGTIGHSPFTASDLHAVAVQRPDGAACVRLYEYERMRGVIFSIEFTLGASSRELLVRVQITNPREQSVPMYWWSNIAVPQTEHSRAIVPATAAWQFDYAGLNPGVPVPGQPDVTYPARAPEASDYFFDLGGLKHPWIAAVDGAGAGLLQVASSRLRGRKLFVWGTGRGGQHWQSWLSHGTGEYLEIQAGLARTQLEHLEMPGEARWEWVESYSPLQVPPDQAHGPWDAAIGAVESDAELRRAETAIDAERARDREHDVITETLWRGSGWGALENRRRAAASEPQLPDRDTPFTDDQLSAEQQYWCDLLTGAAAVDARPTSYVTDPAWLEPLRHDGSATAAFHRGVIASASGDALQAITLFQESLDLDESWHAHRALAHLLIETGENQDACGHLLRAVVLNPGHELVIETCGLLSAIGEHHESLRLLDATGVTEGRIQLLRARALLGLGRADQAQAILDQGIEVPDHAEGEDALSALWGEVQRALARLENPGLSEAELAARVRPLPEEYDFTMKLSTPQG